MQHNEQQRSASSDLLVVKQKLDVAEKRLEELEGENMALGAQLRDENIKLKVQEESVRALNAQAQKLTKLFENREGELSKTMGEKERRSDQLAADLREKNDRLAQANTEIESLEKVLAGKGILLDEAEVNASVSQ